MKDKLTITMIALFLHVLFTLLFPLSCRADETAAVEMLCLNIGKADCILLRTGNQNFLVDAGNDFTYPALETALKEMGIRCLNGVFLTHCDKDHYGGLLELSKSGIQVEHWYASDKYISFTEAEHPLRLAAVIRGMRVEWLKAGDCIPLADGSEWRVLGPDQLNTDNENNNSLVLMLVTPYGNILLTGDMKLEEEENVMESGMLLPCKVLKAAHHGDNNATSQQLLQTVRPQLTVISTFSPQEPDTPSKEVLRRLIQSGSRVAVTQDYHDAVKIRLDENGQIIFEDVIWPGIPEKVTGLTLKVDLETDRVTVQNQSGQDINLNQYTLFSDRGGEEFTFSNTELKNGCSVTIGSKKSGDHPADLYFSGKKRIWEKKKRDVALLVDPHGRIVSYSDNGISE